MSFGDRGSGIGGSLCFDCVDPHAGVPMQVTAAEDVLNDMFWLIWLVCLGHLAIEGVYCFCSLCATRRVAAKFDLVAGDIIFCECQS